MPISDTDTCVTRGRGSAQTARTIHACSVSLRSVRSIGDADGRRGFRSMELRPNGAGLDGPALDEQHPQDLHVLLVTRMAQSILPPIRPPGR